MGNDLIQKWLDGTLTEDERRSFESSDSFRSLEKLSLSLQAFKAPAYDVESERERLQIARPAGKVTSFSGLGLFLRIAAGIALIAGLYYAFVFTNDTSVGFDTLAGKKADLLLPDSSFVVLNASSNVSYSKGFKERKVQLEGEAYFKVKKGSRFDVVTSSGIVTVLGTQFSVKNRENFFEVICYEGSVRVESAGESVRLTALEGFRSINRQSPGPYKVQNPVPSWLNNESSFQSVPFSEVVHELERQYGVSVSTADVDLSQLFTGRFPHNDLPLALKSITIPLNLVYNIQDNQHIVLSGDLE